MEPPPEPDGTPPEWEHLEDELRREAEPDPQAEAVAGSGSGFWRESSAPTTPAAHLGQAGDRPSREKRSRLARRAGWSNLGLGLRFGAQESARQGEGSDNPLSSFPAEDARAGRLRPQHPPRRYLTWALAGIIAVVLIGAVVRFWPAGSKPSPPVNPGTVVIESRPPAATVSVDGQPRGVTPVKLSLAAGTHVFTVALGDARREITRKVEAGAQIYEYLDLPQPATTGQLSVVTNPPGARVIVDGTDRGISPIELTDLATGMHRVTLEQGQASVDHQVTIRAGVTATLVVPLGPRSRDYGYLSVSSVVPLEVFEDGNLIGSSQSERIMMSAGRHTLDVASDSLGFRAAQRVTITPGAVSRLSIELPSGTLSLNAVPWAEVWMDGRRVGETPIANLTAPIGAHEIIFRHPQLGEQRRSVIVTLKAPARLGVDLRQ
jgi:hypothetical protein